MSKRGSRTSFIKDRAKKMVKPPKPKGNLYRIKTGKSGNIVEMSNKNIEKCFPFIILKTGKELNDMNSSNYLAHLKYLNVYCLHNGLISPTSNLNFDMTNQKFQRRMAYINQIQRKIMKYLIESGKIEQD